MRKIIWWSALICLAVVNYSCADDLDAQEIQPNLTETRNAESTIILAEKQQSALNYLYEYCVENFSKELGEAAYIFVEPTNEEKIAVVRFVDYCLDNTGDFLCEIPAYDDVKEILWPDGFGVFKK